MAMVNSPSEPPNCSNSKSKSLTLNSVFLSCGRFLPVSLKASINCGSATQDQYRFRNADASGNCADNSLWIDKAD